MKKFFFSIFTLILLGSLPGFSQVTVHDANAVVRNVPAFNSIVVSSAIDLYFTQSSQTGVAVSANDDRFTANISTEVRENTLYIDYKGSNTFGPKFLRAYVSSPEILRVIASGACNVRFEGEYKGKDLNVTLSGSSDFRGKLYLTNLNMQASGSSDIYLEGSAVNFRADISGSSDLKAQDLVTEFADISAAGASDVTITVNKEMKAKAAGASAIKYLGDGVVKEVSTTGASDIKRKN